MNVRCKTGLAPLSNRPGRSSIPTISGTRSGSARWSPTTSRGPSRRLSIGLGGTFFGLLGLALDRTDREGSGRHRGWWRPVHLRRGSGPAATREAADHPGEPRGARQPRVVVGRQGACWGPPEAGAAGGDKVVGAAIGELNDQAQRPGAALSPRPLQRLVGLAL